MLDPISAMTAGALDWIFTFSDIYDNDGKPVASTPLSPAIFPCSREICRCVVTIKEYSWFEAGRSIA